MIESLVSEALEWRYATKKYDPSKKISSAHWDLLKKSLHLAPSSYGVQPWKFLLVENSEVRERLKAVSWNQSQVTDCSHYVVFLYKESMDLSHIDKFISRTAEVRQQDASKLEGFRTMLIKNLNQAPLEKISTWAQRQTYIAMGFLLQTAALLKIDSTPIEGLEPEAYDQILGLEGTGWKTVATVALGYRHDEDKYQSQKKVRFNEEDVIQIIK